MRLSTDTRSVRKSAAIALCIACLLTLAACATTAPSAGHSPAKLASGTGIQQEDGGFTLIEKVHVAADTRADFDSAVRLLESKEYEEGIALLVKVTQKAPELTAAYVDLGMAYGRTGDLGKAQSSLKRALELDPKQVVAYDELGMVYRRQGQFAAARASYEQALALAPGFHFARLNLAILCDLYLADVKCALENYLAYQQAVPDDKQAAMWIADLRARTNQ